MTNKNTLEIIIKANSQQAIAALNKLQSTVSKPFAGLQKQVGALGDAFTAVTGFSLGAAGAFTALGMAASKAVDFVKQSVTETVAYAQSVRELSYVLGTNAEETSRIVQVADDYLISTEKLTTALRFAVKNGFEPSIESLAQLADEFNAISDPNERAARMVQIFGRNWSALVPLLKAGGAAIRENAAAINDALIITEASQDAIFEYQQSLDNLDDTVQALKVSIGMAMVPALNDALGVINKLTPALNLLDDVAGQNVISAYALAAAYMVVSKQDFSLEGFAKAAQELNAGFEAAQKGAAWKPYDEIKRGVQGATDALEDGEGAVKDYAKAITRLGLSTAQENEWITQFATALGGVDTTALVAANDMDLLDAAVAANAVTLQEYTDYSLEAAQASGILSDVTRDHVEEALKAQQAQAGLADAIKETANAATVLRDIFGSIFDRTERWEGPRERVRETFEAMKAYLASLSDPQEIVKFEKVMEAYGIAFGLFTPESLAVEKAQIDYEALIGQVIDPVKAQAAMEAAFRNWKPGMVFDVVQIMRDAGLLPDDSIAAQIQDEWNNVLQSAFTGIGQVSGESPADRVAKEYEGVAPALIGAFQPLIDANLSETVAQPAQQTADAVGALGENAGVAQTNIGGIATNTGTFATNAATLNEILNTLPSRVENLGKKAVGAVLPMRDLATAIGDAAKSAQGATTFVTALAQAIAALKDKTVTITANVVVNDPLGILGGGGGGVVPTGYQRNQPRARGGTVKKAQDYLVGERGPELFVPSENGTIIPANTTQSVMRALAAIPQEEDEKIPGYARGGRPKRKKPAIVGERGPELFLPTDAGTVIPANTTQAVVEAVGILMGQDAFGGNRGKTPAERAKNRRPQRQRSEGEPSPIPISGAVPQPPPGYQFLGENLNAYLDLFRPPFSTATSNAPEPARPERTSRDTSRGGGTSRFPGRGGSEPQTAGQWRRQQQALQQALTQTYQPLGSNLFQAASQGSGILDTEQAAVATAATETERIGKTVTYNNYFPVQKLEDELDARDLARKVAAELARMPSR